MTLTDTAQLMGNFGEFFGAISVVATLGYLVVQIKQAGRATIFSSEQRRSEAVMNLLLMPAHDSGLRDAMRKVGGFNPHFERAAATLSAEFDLDETEAHQLASYWGAFFGMWEEYYENQLRNERPWFAVQRRIRVQLQQGQAAKYIWDELRELYDPGFVNHVDRLLAQPNQ